MINLSLLRRTLIGDRVFYREVAAVALPIIVQQLVATLMGFIDSIMVGQINAESLAGVAISNKYFMIMQAALFGITGGLGIFISQYYGADDHEKGQGLFVINVLGSITVSGLFFLLISLFPQAILGLFVSDSNTISYGMGYLSYIRFSYLPFAFSLACMTSLRSIGRTRPTVLIGSLAILLNTGLNYLLIFGKLGLPALGTTGAGLATMIARLFEMSLYIALLLRGNNYFTRHIHPVRLLNKVILSKVAGKTLPLISNEFLWSIGITVLFWTYTQLDEAFIPALTVVEMTGNFIFIIFGALGASVSLLVGARLGRSQFAQAKANAYRLMALGAALAVIGGVIVVSLSGVIPNLFNMPDHIRQLASQLLRINAPFYGLITVNVSIFFILRIGGATKATLIMDSGFIWFFVIPLALVFSLVIRPPLLLFYLTLQSTELVKAVISTRLFRKDVWVNNLT